MERRLARLRHVPVDLFKLLFLILAADKSLDCADCRQSLLNHLIQPVHNRLQARIHRRHLPDNQKQHHRQNWRAYQKNKRQTRIHPEG